VKVRVSSLALLAAVLPALVFAYPGFGGGRGILRAQNALVEDEAGLTVSLHALARNADFVSEPAKSTWVTDVIVPELSYAPIATKYVGLELFGSWGGAFQLAKSATEDGFDWGMSSLKAGGKLSIPVLPVLKLGGMADYRIIDPSDKAAAFLDRPAFPYNDDKLAWSGLLTLQFQDLMSSLPNLIVNYGKVAGQTQYAAAVELQGKGFGLFAEMLSLQPDGSAGFFDRDMGHVHLTPGIVLGDATSGFLKAGYSFSLDTDANPAARPNEILVGLGFATPFGKRTPAQYGTITGTVVNSSTGEPVAAMVTFPDHPRLPILNLDATGVFDVAKVPVGAVTVEVSADGYNKQAVPLAVEANKVTNYAFQLRPLKVHGTIAGTVVDAVTNAPLFANIEFPGTDIGPVKADAVMGAFKVDKVETGVYTLTATADKHIPATITLAVEENKLATATFKLSPAEVAVAITGKVSDKKTGDGLDATVTFPEAGNAVFKTDPATGIYKAQLMAGSYTVIVESKDYLKQTSAMVVEKGKPMVKNFELVKEGMAITLRGIYFNTAKATIKPESRPALEDAAKILKDNPEIRVEIQGHTDSQGSDAYNLTLSDQRAYSVVNYLIQNFGIDAKRLVAKGYGEARPVADNATAEGRALNRRVEFVILGQQ